MKFTCSVTIKKLQQIVIDYFINPDFIKEYQKEFIKKEYISGEAQQTGTISKLYYKMGKAEMVLTETILENKLPDYFFAQYYHKHTENTMKTTFTEMDAITTKVESEIEYTEFKGFVVKILAFIAPSFFKKQVQKWLVNLKVFDEKQV